MQNNLAIPAQYPYNTRMTVKKQPHSAEASQGKDPKLTIAVLKQMLTLATSGFGLVAALAWNSAIQELVNTYIKPYLPVSSGLISLVLYAILVTIIAVMVTVNLSKIIQKLEKQPDRLN